MHASEHFAKFGIFASLLITSFAFAGPPALPGIGEAMQEMVAKSEIAGAVTMVVSKDKILHLESTGFADVASK